MKHRSKLERQRRKPKTITYQEIHIISVAICIPGTISVNVSTAVPKSPTVYSGFIACKPIEMEKMAILYTWSIISQSHIQSVQSQLHSEGKEKRYYFRSSKNVHAWFTWRKSPIYTHTQAGINSRLNWHMKKGIHAWMAQNFSYFFQVL